MTDGPHVGPPRRGTAFSRGVARGVMRLFGWRVVGGVPDIPQCVVIVAPHTSNWDFPLCIFTMFATGLRLNWYGKHTLFRFPVKSLLHWFGGEPIDRSTAGGHVDAAIARFREGSPWVLGVSPEGTRKLPEQWRLGFYRIAMGASVPVLTVSLDYRARVVTLGQPIAMTGDQALDLAALDARFTREMARYPQQYVGALRA